MIDMTNKRFGRLIALYYVGNGKWHCKCDCGKEKDIRGYSLRCGATQSCGCLQKEQSIKNLIGQRFGKLVVIEDSGERYNRNVIWLCKCDCGSLIKVRNNHLIDGHVISCGCLSKSKGQIKIEELLTKAKIPFIREKTFQDCRFSKSRALARFDFYVNNQYIIEFDGEQHFKPIDYWGGEEGFNKRKQYDNFKTQWCKQRGIPIIRIPYFKLGELSISDLLLKSGV